jgi:hypothetical protein
VPSTLSVFVRLLIVSGAFLPWLVLYVVADRSTSLRLFVPWLRGISVALLGLSIVLYALDYTRLSNILSIYFWGFFCAVNWLGNRYKLYPPPVVTSLNISGHEATGSPR